MSSCFTKATDEIITSSDYTTFKKRRQIYKTMALSLPEHSMEYLYDNRNYKVEKCDDEYILAQSHSYSAYLDMVRGEKYNVALPSLPLPPVPTAVKYKSSLGSFLQCDEAVPENSCATAMLPTGLEGTPPRYHIPTQLEGTSEYRQAIRAQPSAGLYLHHTIALSCPVPGCCATEEDISEARKEIEQEFKKAVKAIEKLNSCGTGGCATEEEVTEARKEIEQEFKKAVKAIEKLNSCGTGGCATEEEVTKVEQSLDQEFEKAAEAIEKLNSCGTGGCATEEEVTKVEQSLDQEFEKAAEAIEKLNSCGTGGCATEEEVTKVEQSLDQEFEKAAEAIEKLNSCGPEELVPPLSSSPNSWCWTNCAASMPVGCPPGAKGSGSDCVPLGTWEAGLIASTVSVWVQWDTWGTTGVEGYLYPNFAAQSTKAYASSNNTKGAVWCADGLSGTCVVFKDDGSVVSPVTYAPFLQASERQPTSYGYTVTWTLRFACGPMQPITGTPLRVEEFTLQDRVGSAVPYIRSTSWASGPWYWKNPKTDVPELFKGTIKLAVGDKTFWPPQLPYPADLIEEPDPRD